MNKNCYHLFFDNPKPFTSQNLFDIKLYYLGLKDEKLEIIEV